MGKLRLVSKNGRYNTAEIIADLSLYYHLAPGDLIMTGTPAGVGALLPGDQVTGVVEGLAKVFYPEASNIVIFVIMAIVLILRPAGLFGKDA